MENNSSSTIEVNWQDKDEAIKVVMNFERQGKCELEDIHSYNSDGVRTTTFYLKNCDLNTRLEIERAMKEEEIRVM